MKKKILLIICSIVMTAAMTACSSKKEEVSITSEPGVLKVGIVDGKDRYAHKDEGNPAGIEADIAEIVAEDTDYELRFFMVDSEQALFSGMMSGKYDLGFGRITDTDKRIGALEISDSYGKGGLFLVTPRYNYMDCLTTMQMGTIGVSEQAEGIKDEVDGIESSVTEVYTVAAEAGEDIKSGKIAAALVSEREAVQVINDKLQAQELVNTPKERYVALLPKGSTLKQWVNNAITEYKFNSNEEK
ncbi:transporter substrate-binding domain-containing protein [Lachnospiraceae bacterium C1.1]|nr:transporter substrate-binding domain-containing protein [Lachnospiraceae bacterium C1.1]